MDRRKILIVDTIPENLDALSGALGDDYDIFSTASGRNAHMATASLQPDLILLDATMEETDGYEVCAALKRDPVTRDIPVIFITPSLDSDRDARALAAGGADVIRKPYPTELLRARVGLHLERACQRHLLEELTRRLDQSQADSELANSRLEVFSTAVEQSPTSVVITGADVLIQYVNPRFSEESGYSSAEVIGQNPRMLGSALTDPAVFKEMWRRLASGEPWTGEFVNRRKSGDIYWEEAHIAPVKDAEGRTTHYVAVKLDITERKEAQERLTHMAYHDTLTNLPNRTLFFELVSQGLLLAKRNRSRLALLYIDLDRFKPVNDTYGHAAGDLVLQEVAVRMTGAIRASDCVGRIGGDEFVVLLQDVSGDDAVVGVAEKIRHALNQPIVVAGTALSISSSIGVAMYPEHGSDADELARHADSAMYLAKESGRNNIKVFTAIVPADVTAVSS